MNICKGDKVQVITGNTRDHGKIGKILMVYPKSERVLVEGVNFIKKHLRAGGEVKQAGIIDREAPIQVSNVMLVCGQCNKPSRIGFKILSDGRRARVCRSCHEVVD